MLSEFSVFYFSDDKTLLIFYCSFECKVPFSLAKIYHVFSFSFVCWFVCLFVCLKGGWRGGTEGEGERES